MPSSFSWFKKVVASVLIACLLGNQLLTIDITAGAKQLQEDKMVLLLVERSILNEGAGAASLGSKIYRYAEDIQKTLPQTRTSIMVVDRGDSPLFISRLIEQVYHDMSFSSSLEGVVLIGDIPLPRVEDGDKQYLSMYPYTDFVNPAFRYDEDLQVFIRDGQTLTPQAEIWHGVLRPPVSAKEDFRQLLSNYFDKNHAFHAGEDNMSQFDEKVFVADFISENESINQVDLQKYEQYVRHMNDREYNRYNKAFLRRLYEALAIEHAELYDDENLDNPFVEMLENVPLIPDVLTKNIIDQYLIPMHEVGRGFLEDWNTFVEYSGRWDSGELDTVPVLISKRDSFSQKFLRSVNDAFEREVDGIVVNQVALPGSVVKHIEPTPETLSEQVNKQMRGIPDDRIPVDTPRHVSYVNTLGREVSLEYPNFYDISDQTQVDLVRFDIEEKLRLLAQDLARQSNAPADGPIADDFFIEFAKRFNIDLIADLVSWNNLSAPEKQDAIIRSYLSESQKILPLSAPLGYELLYMRGKGNFTSVDMSLSPTDVGAFEDEEFDLINEARDEAFDNARADGEEGPSGFDQFDDIESEDECGDVEEGVEIWEWFPAVACWLKTLKPAFTNTNCSSGESILDQLDKDGGSGSENEGDTISEDQAFDRQIEVEVVKPQGIRGDGLDLRADGQDRSIILISVLDSDGSVDSNFNGSVRIEADQETAITVPDKTVAIQSGEGEAIVEASTLSGRGIVRIVDTTNRAAPSDTLEFFVWPLEASILQFDLQNTIYALGEQAALPLIMTDEHGNLAEGDTQSVTISVTQGEAVFYESEDLGEGVETLTLSSSDGRFEVPIAFLQSGSVALRAESDNGLIAETQITVLSHMAILLEGAAVSDTPNVYQITASIRDENDNIIRGLNSDVLLKSQPVDAVNFAQGAEIDIVDGQGQIFIQVLDSRRDVSLFATHLNYIPGQLNISKQTGTPFALTVQSIENDDPSVREVGLRAFVIDSLGRRLPANLPVSFRLTQATAEAGNFAAPSVVSQLGQAETVFVPNRDFVGEAHIVVESPGLVPATLSLPVGYRLHAQDLQNLQPQSLYTMLLGFPAGEVFEKDYFGGWQLFSGKNQAVTAFSAAQSQENYAVSFLANGALDLSEETSAHVLRNRDVLGVEITDASGIPIMEKDITPLDLLQFGEWDGTGTQTNGVYFENLEADERIQAAVSNGSLQVLFGSSILFRVTSQGGIQQFDNHFELNVSDELGLDHMALDIRYGPHLIGRLHYNFPVALRAADFRLLSAQYELQSLPAQTSATAYPVYALVSLSSQQDSDIAVSSYRGEGWMDAKKQALLYAGNNPLGVVTRENLSLNEIFLGDPSVILPSGNERGASGFDKTVGIPLLEGSEGKDVLELIPFDYNSDQQSDLLVRYGDGVIDLLTGIRSYPYFSVRREFLRFAEAETDLTVFDSDGDGDEDLLVALENREILLIENDNMVFRESVFPLGVDSGIQQIDIEDLDKDGNKDLLAAFTNGNLRAYFLDSNSGIDQVGDLGNYGGNISGGNIASEMLISYAAANPIQGTSLSHGLVPNTIVSGQADGRNYYPNQADGVDYGPNQLIADVANNSQNSFQFDVPNEQLESNFLEFSDVVALQQSSKTGIDLNGGTVDQGDIIRYTLQLRTTAAIPDLIVADPVHQFMDVDPSSVTCSGCDTGWQMNVGDEHIFFGRLNLSSGQFVQIEYDAQINKVPAIAFSLLDLPSASGEVDQYPDIVVSSQDQTAGEVIYLISNGPRSYQASLVEPQAPQISIPELTFEDRNGNNVPDRFEQDANNDGETDVVTEFKRRFGADRDGDNTPDYYDDYPEDNTDDSFGLWSKERFDWDSLEGSDGDFSASFGIRGLDGASYSLPPEAQEILGKMGALVDNVSSAIEKFKCGGGCIAMPINFAFLVPGDISVPFGDPVTGMGQVVGKMPGTPIVGAPGIYPKVICNAQECYFSGSTWRLYISPTLTGGIGFAFCVGTTLPDPTQPRGGMCYVFAPELPGMDEICEAINSQISDIISSVEGAIDTAKSKSTFKAGKGPLKASGSAKGSSSAGGYQMTFLNVGTYDVNARKTKNRRLPSFDDLGGIFTQWWDRQSGEIVNKLLTLPTLRIILPDFSQLKGSYSEWWNEGADKHVEKAKKQREKEKAAREKEQEREEQKKQDAIQAEEDRVSTLEQELEEIKQSEELSGQEKENAIERKNRELRNARLDQKEAEEAAEDSYIDRLYAPLEEGPDQIAEQEIGGVQIGEMQDNIQGMYAWIKSMPLLNVEERKVVFKYPFISKQAIEYLILDLEQWIIDAENEINRAAAAWTNFTDGCSEDEKEELKTRIREQGGLSDTAGRNVDKFKLEQCQQAHLGDKIIVDARKLIADVKENIEILKSYKDFPRKLLRFKYAFIEYLDEILCMVEKLVDVFGGYFKQLKKRIEAWIELVETIQEIWETIGLIPEMFNDLLQDCTLCNNERFSLSIAGLIALVMPDLPIIKFPKWPDIELDLSNIDVSLTVPFPIIDFQAEEIIFPKLPRLSLPDVPSVHVELPGIPTLPRLPDLPELPKLPEIPIPQLPNIPPPPKLPEIFAQFKGFIELIKKILKLLCLYYKMVLPINEEQLKPTIERYTLRPGFMLDFDFIFTLDIPDVELGFVDKIQILFKAYLDVQAGALYSVLQEAAKEWNAIVTDLTDEANDKLSEITKGLDEHLDQSGLFPDRYDIDIEEGTVKSQGGEVGTLDEEFGGTGEFTQPIQEESDAIEDQMQDAVDELQVKSDLEKEISVLLAELEAYGNEDQELTNFLSSHFQNAAQLKALNHYLAELRELIAETDGKYSEVSEVRESLGLDPVEVTWNDEQLDSGFSQLYKKVVAYKEQVASKTVISEDIKLLSDTFIDASPYKLASKTQDYDFGVTETVSQQSISYEISEEPKLLAQRRTPAQVGRGRSGREVAQEGELEGPPRKIDLGRIPSGPMPTQDGTLVSNVSLYQPCGIMVSNNEAGIIEPLIAYDREACDFTTSQSFIHANDDDEEDIVYSVGDQIYLKLAGAVGENGVQNVIPTEAIYYNDSPLVYNARDYFRDLMFTHHLEVSSEDQQSVELAWDLRSDAEIIDVAYTDSVDGFLNQDESEIMHHTLIVDTELIEDIQFGTGEAVWNEKLSGPLTVYLGSSILLELSGNQTLMLLDQMSDGVSLTMENGFYYARTRVWHGDSQGVMYGNQIAMSPSARADIAPPLIPIASTVFVPVNTPYTLKASEIIDSSGIALVEWDLNNDGVTDKTGAEVPLGPFETLESHTITMSVTDAGNNRVSTELTLTVFAPQVFLTLEDSELQGYISPAHENVPVTLLRKRLGQWKAIVTPEAGPGGKYLTDSNGEFKVSDLKKGQAPYIKDVNGNLVALYDENLNTIRSLIGNYAVSILPADDTYPMRFVVMDQNGSIVGNQIIVADSNSDVQITSGAFESGESLSVVVSDALSGDSFEAQYISLDASDYAGGVLIVDSASNRAAAAIHRQGSIRLFDPSLSISFQASTQESNVFQFQIMRGSTKLFDVYVPIEDDQAEILFGENWGTSEIGGVRGAANAETSNAALLSAASVSRSALPSFSDVPSTHAQFESIEKLKERGVIEGYVDGTFRPDARISRPEFVKIVLGATTCLDCTNPPAQEKRKFGRVLPFPDVLRSDWFFYCISKAKFLEMVEGYGDGYFHPERNISRAEAVAVLLRQARIPIQISAEKYIDVPEYAWYRDYIYTGIQMGLTEHNRGVVKPDEKITRAEFAKMASRVIEIRDCYEVDNDGDGMADYFEIQHDLDANNPSDGQEDADGDGISNVDEFENGLDPRVSDELSGEELRELELQEGEGRREEGVVVSEEEAVAEEDVKEEVELPLDVEIGRDDCPDIPKNLTNILYVNGCPAITDIYRDLDPGIYLIPGDPSICGGIDWSADIMPGDIFMAAITSRNNQVVFERSREVEVGE